MKRLGIVVLFILSGLLVRPVYADSVTINFEDLPDSTAIDSSYSALGVIFSNAVVATAGQSLNEGDFPPHSGTNVAVDGFGPITLSFITPVTSFSGFFTYSANLTITAFNSSDQVLGSVFSLFDQNFVSSGNPPNELIQIGSVGNIDHLTIAGNPSGLSFAMDDVSFTQSQNVQVPEPSVSVLALLGLFTCVIARQAVRMLVRLPGKEFRPVLAGF